MNRNECKIIQDLLPNYIENLTSVESNEFIESHLTDCKECKKSLDIMKKEIAIDNKKASKQVDYLKRYKRKMAILKTVIALVAVFILAFLGFKICKWQLLLEIYQHNSNYEVGNNFKMTSKTSVNGITNVTQSFYKDGIGYLKVKENAGVWEDANIKYMLLLDEKKYVAFDKSDGPFGFCDTVVSFMEPGFSGFDLLKAVLFKNIDIHEEEYGEYQCYVILYEDQKIWIDKESMFVVRYNFGSAYEEQVVEYKIEVGVVTDEDVALPDLSEYTEMKR